jgi:hypothetical protein
MNELNSEKGQQRNCSDSIQNYTVEYPFGNPYQQIGLSGNYLYNYVNTFNGNFGNQFYNGWTNGAI